MSRHAQSRSIFIGCALGLLFAALPGLAHAQTIATPPAAGSQTVESDEGWLTYVNQRFGMQLSYPPEIFVPGDIFSDGSGRRFEGEGASFEVFGWDNEKNETSATLAASLIGSEGYEHLARQEVTDSELVVSGRRSDREFLERYIVRGTTVQAFGMEYPVGESSRYTPLADAISVSFIHGSDAAGLCRSERSCPPLLADLPSEPAAELAALRMPVADAEDRAHPRIIKPKAAKAKKAKNARGKKTKDAKGKKADRKKFKKHRGKGRKK